MNTSVIPSRNLVQERIVSLFAGGGHSFFVEENGALWACGEIFNSKGRALSRVPLPFSLKSIASNSVCTYFLDENGSIWHHVEDFSNDPLANPEKFGAGHLPPIIAISAREFYSLFLDESGSVWSCGSNDFGKLGLGDSDKRDVPCKINDLPPIQAMSVGFYHTLLLDENGSVWVCGRNEQGQLGTNTNNQSKPIKNDSLPPIQQVAAGASHSIFLDIEGFVWVCGENWFGQLGLGDTRARWTPEKVEKTAVPIEIQMEIVRLPEIILVSAGNNNSVFVDATGSAWLCGENTCCELGLGDYLHRNLPFKNEGLPQLKLPFSYSKVKSARNKK